MTFKTENTLSNLGELFRAFVLICDFFTGFPKFICARYEVPYSDGVLLSVVKDGKGKLYNCSLNDHFGILCKDSVSKTFSHFGTDIQ